MRQSSARRKPRRRRKESDITIALDTGGATDMQRFALSLSPPFPCRQQSSVNSRALPPASPLRPAAAGRARRGVRADPLPGPSAARSRATPRIRPDVPPGQKLGTLGHGRSTRRRQPDHRGQAQTGARARKNGITVSLAHTLLKEGAPDNPNPFKHTMTRGDDIDTYSVAITDTRTATSTRCATSSTRTRPTTATRAPRC